MRQHSSKYLRCMLKQSRYFDIIFNPKKLNQDQDEALIVLRSDTTFRGAARGRVEWGCLLLVVGLPLICRDKMKMK